MILAKPVSLNPNFLCNSTSLGCLCLSMNQSFFVLIEIYANSLELVSSPISYVVRLIVLTKQIDVCDILFEKSRYAPIESVLLSTSWSEKRFRDFCC